MVSLGPHILGRIELRRVRREVMDVQSGMRGEERADLAAPMDGATIPAQLDRSTQVAQEVTEEGLDVEAGEVVRPTPEVERHPAALGRDRQRAADRQAIVAVVPSV